MAIIRQENYPLVGRLQRAISAEGTVSEFREGDFTADAGSWVVKENYQLVRVTRIGQLALVRFRVTNSTVTGAPGELRIALPLGLVAASDASGTMGYIDNGAPGVGIVSVQPSETFLRLAIDMVLAAWSPSVDNTTVAGQILLEARPVTGQ